MHYKCISHLDNSSICFNGISDFSVEGISDFSVKGTPGVHFPYVSKIHYFMKAPLEPEKDFGVSASRGGISRLSHSMLSSPSPPPESSSLSSSSFSLISMIFLTKYWIVRGSVCVGNLSEPDAAHSGRSPSQVHPWYCWVSTHKGRFPRKKRESWGPSCPN